MSPSFCKTFSPCWSVTSYGIDFLKVHFRGVLLVTSGDFVALVRSRSTLLWRWRFRSRLVTGPVVERHFNYSMTFQVPLRQFTSLGVKFDLYGHFKVAHSSFQYFSRLKFWWFLITTLYQLMLQSWNQKTAQSTVNTLVLISWHNRLP